VQDKKRRHKPVSRLAASQTVPGPWDYIPGPWDYIPRPWESLKLLSHPMTALCFRKLTLAAGRSMDQRGVRLQLGFLPFITWLSLPSAHFRL